MRFIFTVGGGLGIFIFARLMGVEFWPAILLEASILMILLGTVSEKP